MFTRDKIHSIRKDFPGLLRKIYNKPLVYLDNASSTLKPQIVIDSLQQHYSHNVANIHRGVHFLSESGTLEFESTRDSIKNFINARFREEIIFTKGTTESLNLLAQILGDHCLQKDSEILLSTMEHHSNIVPWQMIAQKTQSKIREIPIDDSGVIDLAAYKKMLGPKTAIVSITHISNTLGTINPIQEICAAAHKYKAIFILDAAQSISHIKINVLKLNCDFMAFSSHKLFGPTGVGVLYGKKDLLEDLPPYQGGGNMIDTVSFENTTYADLPFKFEAGTPPIAEVIAFKYAIQYIEKLGLNNIHLYELELLRYATEKIQSIPHLTIIGTARDKACCLSFIIKDLHHHDLGVLLDQQGMAIRTGHHCTQPLMKRFNITGTLRISLSFYNTKQEIDCFMIALKHSIQLLKKK